MQQRQVLPVVEPLLLQQRFELPAKPIGLHADLPFGHVSLGRLLREERRSLVRVSGIPQQELPEWQCVHEQRNLHVAQRRYLPIGHLRRRGVLRDERQRFVRVGGFPQQELSERHCVHL